MKHHIRYTGGDLDRAGERRKDADWLSKQLSDPQSHVVPIWRNLNLVIGLDEDARDHAQPEAVIFGHLLTPAAFLSSKVKYAATAT